MTPKEAVGSEEALSAAAAGSGAPTLEGEERPLLMVDIDGVISLFAGAADGAGRGPVEGSFHAIEGIPHFLSATAAAHLLALARAFELVWASGWEERANEHLPHLLGLPEALPFLRFARAVGRANAHWKLDAIDTYAGGRALAWIDDAFNPACHAWAQARPAPTLLVQTEPQRGLTAEEADLLEGWARGLPVPTGSRAADRRRSLPPSPSP
jgi:hypothetical protein